jgi:hypothetical protein
MARTPNVVPAPSSVFSANVSVSTRGGVVPRIAMRANMVAITARLFRTGAYICAANRRFAVSRPPATAPTP